MVALSVYRASHACSYVKTVADLCSSWLESADPQRTVWNKVGVLFLTWVLFASVCCLPNAPSDSKSFETCPFPRNNIHDTFPTGIWPETTTCCRGLYLICEQRNAHLCLCLIAYTALNYRALVQ
jgi:hypothetical protein